MLQPNPITAARYNLFVYNRVSAPVRVYIRNEQVQPGHSHDVDRHPLHPYLLHRKGLDIALDESSLGFQTSLGSSIVPIHDSSRHQSRRDRTYPVRAVLKAKSIPRHDQGPNDVLTYR